MKGLLTYDLHSIKHMKQLLMFVLLGILYLCSNTMRLLGLSFLPFLAVIVICRTVMTQLSKGQKQFMFTLPFSRKEYLLEKYSLALGFAILIFLLLVAIMLGLGMIDMESAGYAFVAMMTVIILYLALMIPIIIRFKEHGTVVFMMISMAFAIAAVSWSIDESTTIWLFSHLSTIALFAVPVSLVLLVILFFLSSKLLEKEAF